MTNLMLNEDLVNRPEDQSVFDISNFKIFKFNTTGYNWISRFFDGPQPKDQFLATAARDQVDPRDAQEFLERCLRAGILKSTNTVLP